MAATSEMLSAFVRALGCVATSSRIAESGPTRLPRAGAALSASGAACVGALLLPREATGDVSPAEARRSILPPPDESVDSAAFGGRSAPARDEPGVASHATMSRLSEI